jgi:hypothetical protein
MSRYASAIFSDWKSFSACQRTRISPSSKQRSRGRSRILHGTPWAGLLSRTERSIAKLKTFERSERTRLALTFALRNLIEQRNHV